MTYITPKRIIKSILLILMAFYYYAENVLTGKQDSDMTKGAKDIKYLQKIQSVLDSKGLMTHHGFSKYKISNFQKSQIKGLLKNFKYKKFDHFTFVTKKHLVHFSVINMNYIYNLSLSVYDKESNKKQKISLDNFPFISKAPQISDDVLQCKSYSFKHKDEEIHVNKIQVQNNCNIEININTSIMKGKFVFTLNSEEEHVFEHLKLNYDGSHWFYGGKYLNQECTADFQALNKTIQDNSCIALVDEGRTVYNYKTEYMWSTGAGYLHDGRQFSFNLGYGMSHPTSEGLGQLFKIDKKVVALNPLQYFYDKDKDLYIFQTHQNFQNIKTNNAQIKFTKLKDNSHGLNLLFIKANLDLKYGLYNGWVTDDEGNQIIFKDIIGLYEEAKFRW